MKTTENRTKKAQFKSTVLDESQTEDQERETQVEIRKLKNYSSTVDAQEVHEEPS